MGWVLVGISKFIKSLYVLLVTMFVCGKGTAVRELVGAGVVFRLVMVGGFIVLELMGEGARESCM